MKETNSYRRENSHASTEKWKINDEKHGEGDRRWRDRSHEILKGEKIMTTA